MIETEDYTFRADENLVRVHVCIFLNRKFCSYGFLSEFLNNAQMLQT